MKLSVSLRTAGKKSDARRIRREGNIPAVLYSQGKPGDVITVDGTDFEKMLRTITSGFLPAMVITLVDGDGKERKVVVKDIQYHVITYRVLHVDFEELHDEVPVKVNVPIVCTGKVDCVGVKLGGVLRQVIRHLRVCCLPKDIPSHFDLDVQTLGLRQSRRLSDLEIPENIRPLTNLKTVAVTVAKR